MLKQKHNFPKQDDIFQNKNYIPNPRRKMCIVLTQLQNIVSVSEFAFPRRIRRVVFRISRFELEERFCSEITSSTFGTKKVELVISEQKRSSSSKREILNFWNSWWRGTVVERRSLAGELSLSCARPVADG